MAMDPFYVSTPELTGHCGIGNHSLYYELRGRHNPEKVVALNGMGMTTKVFGELADKAASKCQIMTFNYRGVRKSTYSPRSSSLTAEVLAFDTLKLLDHVWPGEAVHVMGASMGGFVAQQLALLLLPLKRIKSLQLMVTTEGNDPRLPFPTWMWRLIYPVVMSNNPRKFVHNMLKLDIGEEFCSTSWTNKDGSCSTLGALWAERWEREFDEWWCLCDNHIMAMQCHVVLKYRLWATDAIILRDSGLPILATMAHADRLQPTKRQEQLAMKLQAVQEYGPPRHMGLVGDIEGAAQRTIAWVERAGKTWEQKI